MDLKNSPELSVNAERGEGDKVLIRVLSASRACWGKTPRNRQGQKRYQSPKGLQPGHGTRLGEGGT